MRMPTSNGRAWKLFGMLQAAVAITHLRKTPPARRVGTNAQMYDRR